MKRILITGGAGFIGSHLGDELLRHGYEVRVLDSLSEQVHGPDQERPPYLDPDVELMAGDVRDAEGVRRLYGWLRHGRALERATGAAADAMMTSQASKAGLATVRS